MLAQVILPSGKELEFVKGEKGVKKLFVSYGSLVVVCEDKVLKFSCIPFTLEFERKGKDEDKIED